MSPSSKWRRVRAAHLACLVALLGAGAPAAPVPSAQATGTKSVAIGLVNGTVIVQGPSNAILAGIAERVRKVQASSNITNEEVARLIDILNDSVVPLIQDLKSDTQSVSDATTAIARQNDNVTAMLKELLTRVPPKPETADQLAVATLVTDRLEEAARNPVEARRVLEPYIVPAQVQFLFGSGEAAALSRQTYEALVHYAIDRAKERKAGDAADSAVLADGAPLSAPIWAPCGNKPLAVIFDVDETVILNSGFYYDSVRQPDRPYDPGKWDAWEKQGGSLVDAVPGAVEAVNALRAKAIAPLFITNRSARNGVATVDMLEQKGFGTTTPGETLLLWEDGAPRGKDQRRSLLTQRYCVLAMIGDQLGDFSDLFNTSRGDPGVRRAMVSFPGVAARWGQGWFLLSNPVYGYGITGSIEQVFGADRRWLPPR